MRENVTLEDVAKRAKVSRATVSRAVNKPDSVSPDALKRINKAIADMHYIPNRHARALTGVSSKSIGLIFFHDIKTLFYSSFWGHVINPIYEKLMSEGYELQIIAHSNLDENINIPGEYDSPYAQAIRLAQKGADASELAASCGISRGEADLIVAIYRSAARS